MVLTNRYGETLEATVSTERKAVRGRGCAHRWRYVVRLVEPEGFQFVTGNIGVRAAGDQLEPVSRFVITDEGRTISMGSGEIKRLGTYPIYVCRPGDEQDRRAWFRLWTLQV